MNTTELTLPIADGEVAGCGGAGSPAGKGDG
jgi:hypothetical protein